MQKQLPAGTTIALKQEPLIIDVTELTEQHAGEKIKVYVNKNVGEIEGTLEHVYVAGRSDDSSSRTLVIDGRAFTVSYGSAQLSEW